jgi:GntR family transcriptional regulator, transcriptional repressor for pyruvate dehydrogenase complex
MAPSGGQQVYMAVVESIQQRIADGEWHPGQRLPSINQLAQEFGTSTGPVREAARVLASRGLLRIEHGRGIFVTAAPDLPLDLYRHFERVDTGSVLELFEARRVLEPELAALAAERGTDAEIQAIYALALAMDSSAAAGEDFVEPDIEFHQQIAAAAKNAVLAGIMRSLNELIREGRKLTVELPGMTPRAVRYHQLIAEAIRDRRPLQARLLMLAHVNDAIDSLLHAQPQARSDFPGARASASAVIIGSPAIEHLQERPT